VIAGGKDRGQLGGHHRDPEGMGGFENRPGRIRSITAARCLNYILLASIKAHQAGR
jgi:hypothetical protein